MKFLTLNTWGENGPWRDRWELIFSWLNENKPDVVAFQEIFTPALARLIAESSGYPFRLLPEMRSGLMIASLYPLAAEDCYVMKNQSPTENYLRYALFAKVSLPSCDWAVVNTHLSWKPDESGTRQAQAAELAPFIESKVGRMPVCAAGDFNATPDSPEIVFLTGTAGLSDAYGALHPGRPGLTWDNRNDFTRTHGMPDRRIDLILTKRAVPVSADIVMDRADARGIWPSDHFGLSAVLRPTGG